MPKAIIPDPRVAGSERDDACSAALAQLSNISGAAELNAIRVTAATSSGISYWSIKTSIAEDMNTRVIS